MMSKILILLFKDTKKTPDITIIPKENTMDWLHNIFMLKEGKQIRFELMC